MPSSLEQLTKDAMDLHPPQKLALAERLLASAETELDPEADAAWEPEIQDRIRAIDEGRATGIPHDEVMRAAEKLLHP